MDMSQIDVLRWQDWAGHACYVLLAASYLVTDMYLLRVLAVAALGLEAVYFVFGADSPLWVGIGWNALFVLINVVQLVRLTRDRARSRLSDEEHVLHQGLFSELDKVQFKRLVAGGEWRDVPAGTLLTRERNPVDAITVMVTGIAQVEVGSKTIALLRAGAFVGEMSLLTGENASATVTTLVPSRLFVLAKSRLESFMKSDSSVLSAMHRAIGRDLAVKLRAHVESIT